MIKFDFKKINYDLIFTFLLIIISLWGMWALLNPYSFTSHDGNHQIIRLMNFHKGIVDGQFPVRWAENAMKGYGYPLFIFTYRLPFWIGEIFYLIFSNLSLAINLSFVFSFTASGFSMYWFLRELSKNKLAALSGSILYLYAPYRFVDIYVRAALGEAFCFIFTPLIFLAIYKLSQKVNKIWWIILLAFSFSGLILSHIMTLVLFIPAILGWFLTFLFYSKNKIKYLLQSFLGGLISILLTAYYWFPAFWEKNNTVFNNVIGTYYQDHFLDIKQIIYSPWGYGFSMPGTENDMMSFQLGIAQWLVLISFLGIIFMYLFKTKVKFLDKTLSFNKKDLRINLVLFFTIIFSVILMLPVGEIFFKNLNNIIVIDIPWKFLAICVFLIPVIFTILIQGVKNISLKYLFIVGIIFISFWGNRNHIKVNEYVKTTDKEYFQSHDTSNQHNDYSPKWFVDKPEAESKIIVLDGIASNKIIFKNSRTLIFQTKVESETANIMTNVAYYPGWKVYVNNKLIETKEKDGRIVVEVEQGENIVKLLFTETIYRQVADYVSLLTLISLIIIVSGICLKNKQKINK